MKNFMKNKFATLLFSYVLFLLLSSRNENIFFVPPSLPNLLSVPLYKRIFVGDRLTSRGVETTRMGIFVFLFPPSVVLFLTSKSGYKFKRKRTVHQN